METSRCLKIFGEKIELDWMVHLVLGFQRYADSVLEAALAVVVCQT